MRIAPAILLLALWTTSGNVEASLIGVAQPGIISAVRDVVTPIISSSSVLHTGGLFDGVSGFLDRGGSQIWFDVPTVLEGADYIESSQNNADPTDANGGTVEIEVDVVAGTVLHMFIEDSFSSATPFPWMNLAGFGADWVDSGEDVIANFSFGNLVQRVDFDIWSTSTPLSAGTYVFRQQPVDASFYGIAASFVPEPGILALFGIGLAGLGWSRRKKA